MRHVRVGAFSVVYSIVGALFGWGVSAFGDDPWGD